MERRKFVKSLALFSGATLLVSATGKTLVPFKTDKNKELPEKELLFNLFMDFSALLTGFKVFDLFATGCAGEFFDTVNTKQYKETLNGLLLLFSKEKLKGNPEIEEFIPVLKNNKEYYDFTKKLVKLWYTGVWDNKIIPSGLAYRQGLVWKAMNNHAPGANATGFGTWETLNT
jgi:hypothetical protein